MHAIPIEFCIFAATSNTVQMHENYKESIPSIIIQEIEYWIVIAVLRPWMTCCNITGNILHNEIVISPPWKLICKATDWSIGHKV